MLSKAAGPSIHISEGVILPRLWLRHISGAVLAIGGYGGSSVAIMYDI